MKYWFGLISILFVTFLVSCSSQQKKPDQLVTTEERKSLLREFELANKKLDEKKYDLAIRSYRKILVQHSTTELDTLIHFNLGIAYKEIGECKQAAAQFRRVARRASKKKQLNTQAQALLHLSYAYECLGQDEKLVSSLLDVFKRRKYLSKEVGYAEVPARLAAAYARVGNRKLAKKYFFEAQRGLNHIRNQKTTALEKRDLVAKTLFFMGRIDHRPPEEGEWKAYLGMVRFLQVYLLKAVEMDSPTWSVRAAQDILRAYDQMWDLVQGFSLPQMEDQQLAEKKQLETRISMIELGLELLGELKDQKLPDSQDIEVVAKMFSRLKERENIYRAFLTQNSVVTPLTPEAQRRQGLRRDGRTFNPNPVLEAHRQKAQKLPSKKTRKP